MFQPQAGPYAFQDADRHAPAFQQNPLFAAQPADPPVPYSEPVQPYAYAGANDINQPQIFEWNPAVDDSTRVPPIPGGPLDWRIRQIEQRQNQMAREMAQFDRRLRTVERRVGIPVPPGPGGPRPGYGQPG
ncbi:MAG: hypothetical protein ABF868_00645 [Sporolactobacillus sp.]